MSHARLLLSGLLFLLLAATAAATTWWLLQPPPEKASAAKGSSTPPATVAKPLKEDQLNTITLSPDAMERLALHTGPVERRPVRRSRAYGGEVIIPAGRAVIVSAPLSGTLKAPKGGVPLPGREVKKDEPIFQLLPLLTPEGRVNLATANIEAEGLVKSTQTQLEAAQIALDRAQRVFQSDAGSKRAVDEAQAQYDLARKTLDAAVARRDLLHTVMGEIDRGTTAPLAIVSPEDGLLRTVSALPEQNVPAGAALFEVVDLSRVWVRVPVYVGDLPQVDAAAPARVGVLSARPGSARIPAAPVVAPPSADPLAGTVDLMYELDNRASKYSPGQRVGADLVLKGEAESLACPWSAVIHDIHGGTWVYEQTAERTFVRRRVVVRYVVDDVAVLASGPAPGAKVVGAGAAELFGTETGFTK